MLFDVTGSMGTVPRVLQTKLPQLLGLLLRKGYVDRPADHVRRDRRRDLRRRAAADRAVRVGQPDGRRPRRIFLEGGGGGQRTESYELAMYFMARHTAIDCCEKRGRKGYLFLIGDEMAYPRVKPREVAAVIGDDAGRAIPVAAIVAELQRKFDVYYILPSGGQLHGGDRRSWLLARAARAERHRARRPRRRVRDDRADRRARRGRHRPGRRASTDLADVGSGAPAPRSAGRWRRWAGAARSVRVGARRSRRRPTTGSRTAVNRARPSSSTSATATRQGHRRGLALRARPVARWSRSTAARRRPQRGDARRAAPHVRPVRVGHASRGVLTHLSRHVVVDPLALAAEAATWARSACRRFGRLTVDPDALLITPYHRAANRLRELARGADRHGCCGMGVGETVAYALAIRRRAAGAGTAAPRHVLRRKLRGSATG